MSLDPIFTNGRLVLADRVLNGSLAVSDGHIAAIDPGRSAVAGAIDLDGDLLIPGVIDLHTDNLERQVQPRPNARWPSRSAMIAHDAQCAAAGVTTVFDSFCVGDLGFEEDRKRTLVDGVRDMDALAAADLLKSDHLLHLRCELPAFNMEAQLDPYAEHPRLRLVSVMDHSPGVGQWGDVSQYRAILKRDGLSETEIDLRLDQHAAIRARWRGPNKRIVLDRMRGRAITIASHDDRTEAEVAENFADGIGISEFPVSMTAALAARACGMGIIAGAPNIVRGGSHSGNVAAADMLRASVVDAFASDYVPASLIEAAFMAVEIADIALPRAIGLITDRPAQMAGLSGRGRIEVGLAADLVQVRMHDAMPIVRAVWRRGIRIA
jgi:alpha-D-ribose 1-methylphosphonate 5-triphosphate diphosphatase